ncbi:uncharacterized protein LOC110228968 [Arabidopsis lyrata subsp. lyrata]|nr:uncharacterized protein LOC110228968 [Arabidopsis lyrata subsp. lyrata]|eukprot:XP_020883128.1 uncharacterized protein LOC110228968 [Arabidopsis lyrata subsp. lyrata]
MEIRVKTLEVSVAAQGYHSPVFPPYGSPLETQYGTRTDFEGGQMSQTMELVLYNPISPTVPEQGDEEEEKNEEEKKNEEEMKGKEKKKGKKTKRMLQQEGGPVIATGQKRTRAASQHIKTPFVEVQPKRRRKK